MKKATQSTSHLIIAHAGGMVEGAKYSNSLDAIRFSVPHVELIEVDIVPARDGLIVAHGNFEGKYGLQEKFYKVSVEEFKNSKFERKFQTLSFADLAVLSPELDCKFVLDVKPKGDDYGACIGEIADLCRKHGVFNNFIIQVYCPGDYDVVRSLPFHGVMIAFWKNYSNIFSSSATTFFHHCNEAGHFDFVAASVDFRRINKGDQILDIQRRGYFEGAAVQIYIHGQPEEKESELLASGYGLFSHHIRITEERPASPLRRWFSRLLTSSTFFR